MCVSTTVVVRCAAGVWWGLRAQKWQTCLYVSDCLGVTSNTQHLPVWPPASRVHTGKASPFFWILDYLLPAFLPACLPACLPSFLPSFLLASQASFLPTFFHLQTQSCTCPWTHQDGEEEAWSADIIRLPIQSQSHLNTVGVLHAATRLNEIFKSGVPLCLHTVSKVHPTKTLDKRFKKMSLNVTYIQINFLPSYFAVCLNRGWSLVGMQAQSQTHSCCEWEPAHLDPNHLETTVPAHIWSSQPWVIGTNTEADGWRRGMVKQSLSE